MTLYNANIENFIGEARIPLGKAGPLRVNGRDFMVPLATTEAALVASLDRGAQVITEAGGCRARVVADGMLRAPCFFFRSLHDGALFQSWLEQQFMQFQKEAARTTHHGRLENLRAVPEGNHVHLIFAFTTGDAAGQNMVTIATAAIVNYILANSPIHPQDCFLESTLSGDKKASYQAFSTVRGKRVTAEVELPAELVRERLHTSPERMEKLWRLVAIGSSLSGAMGIEGHYANALAALFMACGQDVACVAEAAVGITRMELTPHGNLYASVTLPNVPVGTVGGGTQLPSQFACLKLLGLAGAGNAGMFANLCAALCLAGELSLNASVSDGSYARAHERLARRPRRFVTKK